MTQSSAAMVSEDAATEDRSGTRIGGRYELRERIGRGGMATVYRGFDPVLAREVAIKILHAGRASADYRRRMLQEGRAAVQAEHPNLLRVFDVGSFEDTTFLVMELLTGCSLAERLRIAPRMPWAEVLRLLLPAVDGFAALHAAGLVHRDIKPANLFLRRRGAEEAIVVVDFGIAKLSPEMFAQVGLVATESGMLLGTPAYMAPEHGNCEPADARSDVYSFGVTLYEALAGRLPFPPEREDNWLSMLARQMYEEVPPLPDDVPRRLGKVVARALAKAPGDRFESMAALADALRECLAEEQAPVVRRRRWPMAVTGGLAIAVVMAVVVSEGMPGAASVAVEDRMVEEPRFVGPIAPVMVEEPVTMRPVEVPAVRPARRDRRGWLAAIAPAVAGCMRAHGDPDAQAARVAMTFDRAGRLVEAALTDRRGSKVGACIVDRVAGRRFAGRGAIVHTFHEEVEP